MKTVWTNGCFDLLHAGHVKLLQFAKSLGDKLIVGINSDEMVRQMKGPTRPVYKIEDRTLLISSMAVVDDVIVFSSQNELDSIIFSIKPDIIVVGDDYKDRKVIGADHVDNVVYFERIADVSTTETISKIKI